MWQDREEQLLGDYLGDALLPTYSAGSRRLYTHRFDNDPIVAELRAMHERWDMNWWLLCPAVQKNIKHVGEGKLD